MEHRIRSARVSDIDKIKPLWCTYHQNDVVIYDTTINPEWCFTDDAYNYYLSFIKKPASIALVVELTKSKQLIGMAFANKDRHDINFRKKGNRIYYINSVYLLEEYRRRGIGRRLFTELLCRIQRKNATAVGLSYYNQNSKAGLFYQSMGFNNYSNFLVKNLT